MKLVLLWLLSCAAPSIVEAQAGQIDVATALQSQNPDEVGRAIATVARQPRTRDIRALAERINSGLPTTLLLSATDALIAAGRPAVRTLITLAGHRRAAVRQRVAEGLTAARSPQARRVLADLLDDPHASVRAAAANGLAALGPGPELPTLVLAARRGQPEAAAVVAASIQQHQVRSVLRELDAETLASFRPVLRAIVRRAELSARAREQAVQAVKALGGAEAKAFLEELTVALPEEDPVRDAVREAVAELADAGGAEDGQ